uniref:Uncharacterized protein n=1 Tax=Aegilops tauschii TaxID=37682 RepID=M8BYE8_AEGTA
MACRDGRQGKGDDVQAAAALSGGGALSKRGRLILLPCTSDYLRRLRMCRCTGNHGSLASISVEMVNRTGAWFRVKTVADMASPFDDFSIYKKSVAIKSWA